jgi:CRP/FNR family transcriptional regulator, cyclic AMP receptor protein
VVSSYHCRGIGSNFNRNDAERLISTTGWLAHCPSALRRDLVSRARLVSFAKDATIYRVEDEPSGIYGLVDGQLRIEFDVFETGEQVAFIVKPGSWVGVASVIHRRQRALTVNCASASTLLFLPIAEFEVLAKDADNMREFAKLAIENNDMMLSAARDLMNSDIRARIASRLIAISGGADVGYEEDGYGQIAITQADLAMVCNVSRKTVNQELAQLENMGVLSRAYRKLFVTDANALQRIAKGDFVHVPAKPGPSGAQPTSQAISSAITVSANYPA